MGCVPARFGPHPVAFNGLRHGVQPKRHPEPGMCGAVPVPRKAAESASRLGPLAQKIARTLEPEPVAERELLELREIALRRPNAAIRPIASRVAMWPSSCGQKVTASGFAVRRNASAGYGRDEGFAPP